MVKKVFTIDTLPGVQRDGTIFDMSFYTDARWVRFQRGRPRKVGGYRAIVSNANGYSRGIYVNSVDGINSVFNGYNNGLEVVNINNHRRNWQWLLNQSGNNQRRVYGKRFKPVAV